MFRVSVFFAFLLVVILGFAAVASAADYGIRLQSRTFTPEPTANLSLDLARLSDRHVIVQLFETAASPQREILAARGLRLFKAMPGRAYLAFVTATPEAKKASDDRLVRWIGALRPSDKIHPMVKKGAFLLDPGFGDGRRLVTVALFPDVAEATGRAVLKNAGAEVLGYAGAIDTFTVAMNPADVATLAEEDAVLWIAEAGPALGPTMNKAKPAVGGDEANSPPYAVTGRDVTVFVLDGGTLNPDGGHRDLAGRVQLNGSPSLDITGHATNVSGIIAGDGSMSDGYFTGMAPEANIVSSAISGGTIPPMYNSPWNMEIHYMHATNDFGATVANNSIGSNLARLGTNFCEYEGDYEATAQLIDALVAERFGRITIVWSVGNERGYESCGTAYGTVAPPGPAKNTIAVGALNKEDLSMTEFSSWGPTDDGRIRPDVSAPGCDLNNLGIISCWLFNFYIPMCGTSQSGPVVTGAVALMQEYWRREIGAEDAWASTMKALVIHGATDLDDPGPDFRAGYGALDVPGSLDLIHGAIILQEELDQDETFSLTLEPLLDEAKVTLVWTDPPSLPLIAGRNLVNDLDLSAETPQGTQSPWVLDPESPALAATKGENHLDPVEQLQFDLAGVDGLVEIVVEGAEVPEGPQRFSLVITGLKEPSGEDDSGDDDSDESGDDGDDDDDGGCGC